MTNLNININAKLNSYSSNRVMIEVVGGTQTGMMRSAAYMLAVPYSQFSQTVQTIHRFGGKIANVTISPALPIPASIEPTLYQFEDISKHIPAIATDLPIEAPLEHTQEILADSPSEPTSSVEVIESVIQAPLEHTQEILADSASEPTSSVEVVESALDVTSTKELTSEPVTEIIPDLKLETAPKEDAFKADSLPTNENTGLALPSSPEKKPETSTKSSTKSAVKSGSGFNKLKNNPSAQKSPRKPKG